MKKVILGICTIVIITVSCNKIQTTIEPTTKQTIKNTRGNETIIFKDVNYQIVNGMLTFETFDKYEGLFNISDPSDLQPFADLVKNSSVMNSYSETEESNEVSDEIHFIGDIVNEQGLIKIDVFTILLDFNSKQAFATKTGTPLNLINAKNGNVSSDVYSFKMEQDVIEELEELKSRGFCNQHWGVQQSKTSNQIETKVKGVGGANTFLITHVQYISSGIWFEMQVESSVFNWGTLVGTTTIVPRSMSYSYWWQRRCSTVSGSGNITSTATQTPGAYTNKYRSVIYSNIRALKHYALSSTISSSQSLIPGITASISISD